MTYLDPGPAYRTQSRADQADEESRWEDAIDLQGILRSVVNARLTLESIHRRTDNPDTDDAARGAMDGLAAAEGALVEGIEELIGGDAYRPLRCGDARVRP